MKDASGSRGRGDAHVPHFACREVLDDEGAIPYSHTLLSYPKVFTNQVKLQCHDGIGL